MAEESQTLREYLDQINIGPGNDIGFVIVHGNVEMQVSRRYLESAPMQHYLDMEIVDYTYPYINVYGVETVRFFIEEK